MVYKLFLQRLRKTFNNEEVQVFLAMVEDINSYLEKEVEQLELEEERLEQLAEQQLEGELHSPDVPDVVKKPEDLILDR